MALKRAIGGSTRSLGARPREEHTGGPLDERSVCRRYSITSCTTSAADAENVAESGLSKTRRRKYRPRTNASNISALTTGRRRRRTRRRRREICVIKLKRTFVLSYYKYPTRTVAIARKLPYLDFFKPLFRSRPPINLARSSPSRRRR